MDILEVDTEQLPALITDILVAGLVPHIQSSPGCGKSDIIKQVAKEYGLKVIDLRLSQMDSVDMQGFPHVVKNKTDWIPPAVFPLEDDPIPEGYNGWLLFLDEITSAPISVQASAYKLILDRMVGQHKLHKKVAMVAAGNLLTDKAIVNRMGTAMQSRMIHLKLKVNPEKWIKWAESNNIDYRVSSFIQFRPDLLHKFDPSHNDVTFGCPRTWDFLSRIIGKMEKILPEKMPVLAGTVGSGAAYEFKGYVDNYDNLPSVSQLLNNPESVSIPREPSGLYAISSLIANYFKPENATKLMKLVTRLPKEFQVISLQSIIRKDIKMIKLDAIKEWIKVNSVELL